MRVADYIAQRIAKETDTVFMLAGGGAMFLNDAFSWCEGLTPVFCHHEQTCSMAAEAFARFNGRLGVANVTTGPGGINALNGVYGAWTDSLPMIVVSGQVKRKTTLRGTGQIDKLRQLGDQEVDIIALAKPITKMATFVSEVEEIPFILEESIRVAKDGRPGPVWIDVPIDIQSADITPEAYFVCTSRVSQTHSKSIDVAAAHVVNLIRDAKRPVFLLGSAVRATGSLEKVKALAERIQIPLCPTWTAVDSVSVTDPLFGERPGTVGTRAGNVIAQQADLIIVLGSRLPIRQVSYNWENFGTNAIKVGVDIDPAELSKPMVALDVRIQADVTAFIDALAEQLIDFRPQNGNWLAKVSAIKTKLPALDGVVRDKGHPPNGLNPYLFIDELWPMLKDDEVIACADASASVIPFQVAPVKSTQRLFTNAGSASMGYELPAAIGAAFANPGKRVICMAGDGSVMLNIQEFETISRYKLPIKILLLNNQGYLSIKLSQQGFFGRSKGADPASGLGFMKFKELSAASNLAYCTVQAASDYPTLRSFLDAPGPGLVEVSIDPTQAFEPKLGSFRNPDGSIQSNSLENMSPLLPEALLKQLMTYSNELK